MEYLILKYPFEPGCKHYALQHGISDKEGLAGGEGDTYLSKGATESFKELSGVLEIADFSCDAPLSKNLVLGFFLIWRTTFSV